MHSRHLCFLHVAEGDTPTAKQPATGLALEYQPASHTVAGAQRQYMAVARGTFGFKREFLDWQTVGKMQRRWQPDFKSL